MTKYILKKRIEGIDWEVGETVYDDRIVDNTETMIIHNLLLNGTIEKVEEQCKCNNLQNGDIVHITKDNKCLGCDRKITCLEVEENKRWRAEDQQTYFYVYTTSDIRVMQSSENFDETDQKSYECGNYFQTEAQAQAVANQIKELLIKSHDNQ